MNPYKAGHVLTEREANMLNAVFRENVKHLAGWTRRAEDVIAQELLKEWREE